MRGRILPWLCFVALAEIAAGQGVTYPDGTVSPFPPRFFGIGIPDPAVASVVLGVAAKGGTFLGAVGTATDNKTGDRPIFIAKDRSVTFLLGPDPTQGGGGFGISGDGTIKVGTSGLDACYWDAQNQVHVLPHPAGAESSAYAISRDGSIIGGEVATEETPGGSSFAHATLWATGGTGRQDIHTLPGFDGSAVLGLSPDGQKACGNAIRYSHEQDPGSIVAFRYFQGESMEGLGKLAPADEAFGYSIDFEGVIVGISGTQATEWFTRDARDLPSGFSSSAALATNDAGSVIGGYYVVEGESTACIWKDPVQGLRGTIAGLLANPYRISVGQWKLTQVNAVSGDGYTVGGDGINPQGKEEGWVAVLPPILHPPTIDPIPPQNIRSGNPFRLSIGITFSLEAHNAMASTNGFPPGFSIDGTNDVTGTWDGVHPPPGTYTATVKASDSNGQSSRSFQYTLVPPDPVKELIDGLGFLPNNKAPGESAYLASFGGGISGNGQVAVGRDGLAGDSRAFYWTPAGGISGLPLLDGVLRSYSVAVAASNDGTTIVGQAARPPAADGTETVGAVVWKPAAVAAAAVSSKSSTHTYAESAAATQLQAIDLGFFPAGTTGIANAVSADGSVVVGYGDAKEKGVFYQIYQAFRWTATDGLVGLGWLPGGTKFSEAFGISADGSAIVGVSDSAAGTQAFRWTQAEGLVGLGILPGGSFARAQAISVDKTTIVGFSTINGNNHAFRWRQADGMVDLGLMSGDSFSEATAVSSDGSIVIGRAGPDFSHAHAFIWDKANGMRDLKAVLVADNPNLSGWKLQEANGLSMDGTTVTGSGINPNGDFEGFTAYLKPKQPQSLNISTRMRVLSGDNVLIGGFIITGSAPKKVIVRGIGPSLKGIVPGVLQDPMLELYQGNTLLASNDNWREHETEVIATTIPPANDLESAIVTTLNPGAYTAILRGKDSGNGVGLVEAYDLSTGTNAKLANISTRGFVDRDDNVMICGVIVGSGSGGATTQLLIRALGPSLSTAGVSGALQDPTLELYDGNGTTIATNNDWKDTQQAAIEATTIPPSDEKESAILQLFPAGSYTAIVRGKNNSTGIGLVEAYNLP